MPRETRIACDHCGRDLTHVEGGGHRIEVVVAAVWSRGPVRGSDLRPRPFPHGLCFCSWRCMEAWAGERPEDETREVFAPNHEPLPLR